MDFEVLGSITQTQTIAVGRRIREISRIQIAYGRGRWRKRKGIARVRLADGTVTPAEIHWYEADGVGRRELKIKRYVEPS